MTSIASNPGGAELRARATLQWSECRCVARSASRYSALGV